MSELSKLNNSCVAMTTKEIADLTGKRHDHVYRDAENMLNELEKDLPKFGGIYKDSYNRDQNCYVLDKELTMTLVSGYNIKMRHAIIQRWQEVERAGKELAEAIQATDYRVLRKMADLAESKQILALENEELRPLAKVTEVFAQSKEDRLIRDFAKMISTKELKLGQNQIFGWLYDRMYLMKGGRCHRMPYQRFIDNGYFNVKTSTHQGSEKIHMSHTTTITAKGMVALAPKIIAHFENSISKAS